MDQELVPLITDNLIRAERPVTFPSVSGVSIISGSNVALLLEIVDTFSKYVGVILVFSGIFTNIFNIIVFSVQGFKDSVNISLTTVAFWDLLKCLAGAVIMVAKFIPLTSSFGASKLHAICFFVLTYLQVIANFVSYPIAAYLAIERALCVAVPFKVKSIFTPRLTAFVMLFVSCSFGMYSFVFALYEIYYRTNPMTNQTLAFYRPNEFDKVYGKTARDVFFIMGIVNPVGSLIISTVCTFIISYHLQKASKFRAQAQNEDTATPKMSTRDRQVVKMLLVVIIMFIVNLIPRVSHQIAKLAEPEFYRFRRYYGEFMISAAVMFFFDIVNASTNFLIFITMSSQFKATFLRVFCCKKPKTKS